MKALQTLYRIAEQNNISVDRFALSSREALSIMDPEGNCYIAIDPEKIQNQADERAKLAHELGHCVTGAFYNRYSDFDCRQKHENTADKWAVRELVAVEELDEAIARGCTQIWELAEYFGITEPMMRKAVCLHVHGNVADELYF